jgi:hypothetical protein
MGLRSALLITFFATSLFAVAPQFWRVRTIDDFLAGDVDGFAITSRGELRAAPSLKKIATFTDPFVLAQTNGANGDRFFGTGNDGKLYRLRNGELKAIYTAPEPEVYALAFRDNAIYAATSPNGKVYRVDPNDGKATVFYDPKQAYIWALQFTSSGDLLVATGVEGKLFRVTPKGEGKVLFTAPESHVRSLALKKDGTILAGGSGKGRIYEVRGDGAAHALFDSALTEISTIYVDDKGIGWAAGVANTLPTSAPAKPAKSAQATTTAQSSAGSTEQKKEGEATVTVEPTFSFEDSSPTTAQGGSGELYRINPDGFVEIARKFDREMVYAISGGPNGSILLSTGPQGRLYSFKEGDVALIANVPEKQIVSIANDSGATLVTTTNSGAVYRMESTPSAKAEFRSASKDIERFSHFGHYRIEGSGIGDGHLAIAFRSGNTRTPDATWSKWSAASSTPEGSVDAPAGRYVQWKLTMPKPSADVVVSSVTVGFMNRNMAPVIDNVVVQDPAVVFISSSYPSSPQVVEATNPDEYGIFTSLESPRDKNDPGKKVFRKGFRSVTWRAHDDNGDSLRYSVSFRPKGSDKWLRLRENIEENQINFDSSQMPDGRYELRLTASDAQDNPDGALMDVKQNIDFQVDNTPPVISFTTEGDDLVLHIVDKASTVGKVEYSVDAQKWVRLVPVDGIADSSDETYKIHVADIAGKFVIVRAVDSFYNVATQSVHLP